MNDSTITEPTLAPDDDGVRDPAEPAPPSRALAVAPTRAALTLDQIAQHDPKRALEIVKARIDALDTIRRAALAGTTGNDWTLNRDKSGQVTATLRRSGAEKIRKYYGISVFPRGPVELVREGEQTFAEVTGDAICALTGERVEDLLGRRGGHEEFVGRAATIAGTGDLRLAARANLDTKAVRQLAGMSAVAPVELAVAWGVDVAEVERRCYCGHGYGRSAERGEARAASNGGQAPAPGAISEAQGKRLWALAARRAEALGLKPDAVVRAVLKRYGVEHTRDLARGAYDQVVTEAESYDPQGAE